MMHRLREAMTDVAARSDGRRRQAVQADETYYGNTSKRSKRYTKGHRHKARVVALSNRKGRVARSKSRARRAKPSAKFSLPTSPQSELHTDESALYTKVGKEFAAHKTVEHGSSATATTSARTAQTTNTVENFFLQFKRGMNGTYIHCGEQHLQRYLNEFEFRYTNRSGLGVNDGERTALMLRAEGKRLTYRPTN